MYNTRMVDETEITAMAELHKFCLRFKFHMELEKPFEELEQLMLKVINSDGEVMSQAIVEDITNIEEYAGKMLNELSRTH